MNKCGLIFVLSFFALESVVADNRYCYLHNTVDLDKSEILYSFERFDLGEWTIRRHYDRWTTTGKSLVGGDPDASNHGQIFYKTPVKGDVVLAFDAQIVLPSYHDIVWFWNVRLDEKPWSDGYLGSLGGWWSNLSGIERLRGYSPRAIGPACPIKPGETYHVVSGSYQGEHFVFVNGKLVSLLVDKNTPVAEQPGYFGLGIYRSMVSYSNLKVYRPYVERHFKQYVPASQLPPPEGNPTYLVIDISNGSDANTYPVRGSASAPDLTDNVCRTEEIWLRRVEPGNFEVQGEDGWMAVKRGIRTLFSPWTWLGSVESRPKAGLCVETRSYYIGVFPVTQRQWELVMGNNPSQFKGAGRPVEMVSYDDIRGKDLGSRWPASGDVDVSSFMGRLRARTGLEFDLPTGSQWELASRAGTTSRFNDGTSGPCISTLGRYTGNTNDLKGGYCEHTTVGLYRPNAIGLYDMHGNVWETTIDWFAKNSRTAETNWPGPAAGIDNMRSRRGGSWAFGSNRCGSDAVGGDAPNTSFNDLGFRAACRIRE